MPRRPPAMSDAPSELRRLHARRVDLRVPRLLGLREAISAAVEHGRLQRADAEGALRAAGQPG